MELKCDIRAFQKDYITLLIVPYGIEIQYEQGRNH